MMFVFNSAIVSNVLADDECNTVALSADEKEILSGIMKKDDFLKKLSAEQKALSSLNSVLKLAAKGPVTLALSWNKATIDGWRIANKNLVTLNKALTCEQIAVASTLDKYVDCFWTNLSKARGCDE